MVLEDACLTKCDRARVWHTAYTELGVLIMTMTVYLLREDKPKTNNTVPFIKAVVSEIKKLRNSLVTEKRIS